MLIADLDVRIIHAATGELIRNLTIDPNRRYHGTGTTGPRDPENQTTRTLNAGSAVSDVLRHHMVAGAGFEPVTFGL